MRALAFITFGLLTVGLAGCATRISDHRALVAQIRNEHVTWDGNFFGLRIQALGEAEKRVGAAGSPCRPFLIEALGDESRYVAAHVLLTQMEQSYPLSAGEWNHLRVVLHADGRVDIPSGQRPAIQRLWTQK